MDKVILPKTNPAGEYYLSYSQIAQWKKSRREYIRSYFLGEKSDNVGLQRYADFGLKVGQAFENADFSGFEPHEQEFLKSCPQYDEFETEIRLDFDGFHVLGFVDSNTSPEDGYVKKLLDYKSADIEKKRADYQSSDYIQTEIYAGAFRQKYGKLPDEAIVVMIGRSGNGFANEELKLTCEMEIVPKQITDERVDEVIEEVKKVALEISRYYQAYLKLNLIK